MVSCQKISHVFHVLQTLNRRIELWLLAWQSDVTPPPSPPSPDMKSGKKKKKTCDMKVTEMDLIVQDVNIKKT